MYAGRRMDAPRSLSPRRGRLPSLRPSPFTGSVVGTDEVTETAFAFAPPPPFSLWDTNDRGEVGGRGKWLALFYSSRILTVEASLPSFFRAVSRVCSQSTSIIIVIGNTYPK